MVKDDESESTIVKLRGLPWSATVEDVIQFLDGVNVKNGNSGVHITMSREGRPSGEAFIELETSEDKEKALAKNGEHMGHRYIEVFQVTKDEMDYYLQKSGSYVENVMDECCIRLRGLPFGCTEADIIQFFEELTIVPNGISFVSDETGRNTGEAYVQFTSKEMVENALKKHLDKIGHRYIEIFRSSLAEIHAQTGPKIRPLMSEMVPRPAPYDRGDRFGGANRFSNRGPPPPPARTRAADLVDEEVWASGNQWGGNTLSRKPGGFASISGMKSRLSPPPAARMHNAIYGGKESVDDQPEWENESEIYVVHMRGLPFRATEQDIADFFSPLVPVGIDILHERGRPSGEANVEFQTYNEASRAMLKDKQNMSNRYIELFMQNDRPQRRTSATGPRNPLTRGFSKFQNDQNSGDTTSLFSRRGGGTVTNSAYDGFYGTATYRAASTGGNFSR